MGLNKVILWVGILLPACFSCRQQPTVIQTDLGEKFASTPVSLYTSDSVYRDTLDAQGKGALVLSAQLKSGYAALWHSRGWINLYLSPGRDLKVTKTSEGFSFKGKGAPENIYLNSAFVQDFPVDYSLEEKPFLQSLERRIQRCEVYVDSLHFGRTFTTKEKTRLYYSIYLNLFLYPRKHAEALKQSGWTPSPHFKKLLVEKLRKEDDASADMDAYKLFYQIGVDTYCLLFNPSDDDLQSLRHKLDYVDRHIRGKRLAAYLTNLYLTGYVQGHGTEGIATYRTFYNLKVSDPKLRGQFEALYNKWAMIGKGRPSPTFRFPDITGKLVSIEDLRGKYVYIDIWATWCTFCVREFPALKRLEKAMSGKNITFVSISCDRDKSVWKDKVEKEQLKGIQLWEAGDKSFRKAYYAEAIPRFILLDPEGKIISPNMTRPSNPKTLEVLTTLPGIDR